MAAPTSPEPRKRPARRPRAASPERIREKLREAGLRVTSARLAVLAELSAASGPVSHADVAEALAMGGWDRATVYRNLTDLTEAGLVRRTDVGDHVWRFEAVREGGHGGEGHPHFMCDACGDVMCLPETSVSIKAPRAAPRALRRKVLEIQIKGRCDRCA